MKLARSNYAWQVHEIHCIKDCNRKLRSDRSWNDAGTSRDAMNDKGPRTNGGAARVGRPSSMSPVAPAYRSRRSRWCWAAARLVAEATRERVSDAMSELGYIYHRGAATLRGAKSGVLGMVINDLSNPFYVELAIGIEQACQGAGFIPVSRQHRRKPGSPATGDPLDARARGCRTGAGAGDRLVAG